MEKTVFWTSLTEWIILRIRLERKRKTDIMRISINNCQQKQGMGCKDGIYAGEYAGGGGDADKVDAVDTG